MCFPCFEDAASLSLEEEVLGGSIEVPQEIMRTRQQKEPWWSKTMAYHGLSRVVVVVSNIKLFVYPLSFGEWSNLIHILLSIGWNPPTSYWRETCFQQPERTSGDSTLFLVCWGFDQKLKSPWKSWSRAVSLDLWGMFGFDARGIVGRQMAAPQNVRFLGPYPNYPKFVENKCL